jgi:hypothetical protein
MLVVVLLLLVVLLAVLVGVVVAVAAGALCALGVVVDALVVTDSAIGVAFDGGAVVVVVSFAALA